MIFLKHDKFEREGETKNKLASRARSKKTTQRYRNATVDEVKSQTALQEWCSGLAFRAENLQKSPRTISSGQRTGFTVVNRALHLALWQNALDGTTRGDNRSLAGSEIQNEIRTNREIHKQKYTVKVNCLSREGGRGSK